jgi:hypothetical protein
MWESGDVTPPFFISALDEDKWSALRPSRFPQEKLPPVPTGRKNVSPPGNRTLAFQTVAIPTEMIQNH